MKENREVMRLDRSFQSSGSTDQPGQPRRELVSWDGMPTGATSGNSNPPAMGGPAVEPAAVGYAEIVALVQRIRTGECDGMEELYKILGKGMRFYLCRQLGPQDLEDKLHDILTVVVDAIRKGELRDPERLMGFVRTVARRQVAAQIEGLVQCRRVQTDQVAQLSDPQPDPEQEAIGKERRLLMQRVLGELSARDRGILIRYYLEEQTEEQICEEMHLSPTQFRLVKSRAKGRFFELGRKKTGLE